MSLGLFLLYMCTGSLQSKWPHAQKGMDVPNSIIAAPGSTRKQHPGLNVVLKRKNAFKIEVPLQTRPMRRQRGKGIQLDALWV